MMRLLKRLLKKDRQFWFVCYDCMGKTGHDALKSVFYSRAPKVTVLGRPLKKCPRCGGTNTKSFAEMHDQRMKAALWGLEQTVSHYPRSRFEIDKGA